MKYFVKSGKLDSVIIANSAHEAVINSIIRDKPDSLGRIIICGEDGQDFDKQRIFLSERIIDEVNTILKKIERREKLTKLNNI